MICSNSKLQIELDNIRSILLKNGYPNRVVNSAITLKLQNLNRPVKFGISNVLNKKQYIIKEKIVDINISF